MAVSPAVVSTARLTNSIVVADPVPVDILVTVSRTSTEITDPVTIGVPLASALPGTGHRGCTAAVPRIPPVVAAVPSGIGGGTAHECCHYNGNNNADSPFFHFGLLLSFLPAAGCRRVIYQEYDGAREIHSWPQEIFFLFVHCSTERLPWKVHIDGKKPATNVSRSSTRAKWS